MQNSSNNSNELDASTQDFFDNWIPFEMTETKPVILDDPLPTQEDIDAWAMMLYKMKQRKNN